MNKYDKLIEVLEKNEQKTVVLSFKVKKNSIYCCGVLMPTVVQASQLMLNVNSIEVSINLEDITSWDIEEEAEELVITINTNNNLRITLYFSEK